MNTATFLEKFDLIAEIPNAVEKMRGLVMQLAIEGKLVDQKDEEGTASKLLEVIRKERENNEKELKIPKEIQAEGKKEKLFGLPNNWKWGYLGNIALRIQYGYTASADPNISDTRMLRITDIQNNQVNWISVPGCQIEENEAEKYRLHPNDILIARTGGTIGKSFIVPDAPVKSVFASYLIRVTPPKAIEPRYLKIFLETPCYWDQLRLMSAGTGQPNVNGQALGRLAVPLPPLAEQKRIVARVDELMALCDQLEARQKERDEKHKALCRAALARFSEDPTPANLEYLFHPSFKIPPDDLRKTILNLAVQGKLVSFGNKKYQETVGEHVEFLNGYAFKSEWFKPNGVRLCRNVNVGHGGLNWKEAVFVDQQIAEEFSRFNLQEGDIVLSLDRPIISTGLKVAKVKNEDLPCLLLQPVAKIIPKHDRLHLPYFLLWLNSDLFVNSIDPGRSNGVPHISTKEVLRLPFAPPGIGKQIQTVREGKILLDLVEQLEDDLAESVSKGESLANLMLSAVVG